MTELSSKRLILLLLDGYGLSTSWKGNALLTAQSKNFIKLWNSYSHLPISSHYNSVSDIGFVNNPESSYATIASGTVTYPDYDTITDAINNGSFVQNPVVNKAFEDSSASQSIHLIGHLPNDDSKTDIKHLDALIDLAQQKGIKRLYLHLILDENTTNIHDVSPKLIHLNERLISTGIGQVATVASARSLLDKSGRFQIVSDFVKATIDGQSGFTALSVEQGIFLAAKHSTDYLVKPIVIHQNNEPVGLISDFDTVFFFDHRLDDLDCYISLLSGRNKPFGFKHPLKNIRLFSFSKPVYMIDDKLSIAFGQKNIKSLSENLSELNFSQLMISDSTRIPHFQEFCPQPELPGLTRKFFNVDSAPSSYLAHYETLSREITAYFLKTLKEFQFVVVSLPFADIVSDHFDFKHTVKAISIIDDLLPYYEKAAEATNSLLMVTSPYGKIESMGNASKRVCISKNPVPFIFASKDHRNKVAINSEPSIEELLQIQYSTLDIAPTILRNFGVDIPTYMMGRAISPALRD